MNHKTLSVIAALVLAVFIMNACENDPVTSVNSKRQAQDERESRTRQSNDSTNDVKQDMVEAALKAGQRPGKEMLRDNAQEKWRAENAPLVFAGEQPVPAALLQDATKENQPTSKGSSTNQIMSHVFIRDARWINIVDNDLNGFASSATLVWDVDAVPGQSLLVHEEIFFRGKNDLNFRFLTRTASHLVTGISPFDQKAIGIRSAINPIFQDQFDFRIDLFVSAGPVFEMSRGPVEDPDLNDFRMESFPEDLAAPQIIDAFWERKVDMDRDTFMRNGVLTWATRLRDGRGKSIAFARFRVEFPGGIWRTVRETPTFEINGSEAVIRSEFFSTDDLEARFGLPPSGRWDWTLQIVRQFRVVASDFRDEANDPRDFKDVPMEVARLDPDMR